MNLEELIAKVEGASGSDREIECRLEWLAQGESHWLTANPIVDGGLRLDWREKAKDIGAKPYMSSVDAALALAASVKLPPRTTWWDILHDGMQLLAWDGAYSREKRKPEDLARFIVLALLKALSDSEGVGT